MIVGEGLKESDYWETPDDIFTAARRVWPFGLDACATRENAKATDYFDESDDGLNQTWGGYGTLHYTWFNPPYSQKKEWIAKAIFEEDMGHGSVGLLPVDTSTRWFHDLIKNASVYLLLGRISFIDPTNGGRSQPKNGSCFAVFDRSAADYGLYTCQIEKGKLVLND